MCGLSGIGEVTKLSRKRNSIIQKLGTEREPDHHAFQKINENKLDLYNLHIINLILSVFWIVPVFSRVTYALLRSRPAGSSHTPT